MSVLKNKGALHQIRWLIWSWKMLKVLLQLVYIKTPHKSTESRNWLNGLFVLDLNFAQNPAVRKFSNSFFGLKKNPWGLNQPVNQNPLLAQLPGDSAPAR